MISIIYERERERVREKERERERERGGGGGREREVGEERCHKPSNSNSSLLVYDEEKVDHGAFTSLNKIWDYFNYTMNSKECRPTLSHLLHSCPI